MSMNRSIAWLPWVVVLAAAGSVQAQYLQPFIDPGYFQPDFQYFAPPEVGDFGGGEPPNTGFYVTFDRTYVNVTRPRDAFSFGSQHEGDFTWGNRFEIGYMTDDKTGWQGVLWHVNGPNEKFANGESITVLQDVANTETLSFVIPQTFDSLNVLKMSSFELNKVWRRKEFHNGAVLEPLLGYRYMNVRDFYQRETLQESVPPPGVTLRANTTATDEFFDITSFRSTFENQMHGGQLGGRLFRQRGHWLLSAEVKFFALANFQSLRSISERSFLPNPDEGNASLIAPLGPGGDVNRSVAYQRASEFVWGGEVRGEAAYELTRDINLRVGFVFLDLGQGIGRGNNIQQNNQAIQMAGVTFGFTVNR